MQACFVFKLWYCFVDRKRSQASATVALVFAVTFLQEGFWSWVSGVTDNSLYPVMFLSYLDALVPGLKTGWQRTILLVVVSLALSYLNYRGLHIVGHTAVFMTGFIILPFLVLMCLALPHIKPGNWGVVDWKAVQWGDFLNVMFW